MWFDILYENIMHDRIISQRNYTVRSGDTFSRILKRYGMAVQQLKEMNPELKDINRINPGDILNVPDPKDPFDDMTDEQLFLARVLYSQTSTKATQQQFKTICKLIINRIGHRGFGRPRNAYKVVSKPGQFSCVKDPKNNNWKQFRPTLNNYTRRACIYARSMLLNNMDAFDLPDVDYMMYHDKSRSKQPQTWINRDVWRTVKAKQEYPHFVFYSLRPKNSK